MGLEQGVFLDRIFVDVDVYVDVMRTSPSNWQDIFFAAAYRI